MFPRSAEEHFSGEMCFLVPRKSIFLTKCVCSFRGRAVFWRNVFPRFAEEHFSDEMRLLVSRKSSLIGGRAAGVSRKSNLASERGFAVPGK